jgi:hypothetical protein
MSWKTLAAYTGAALVLAATTTSAHACSCDIAESPVLAFKDAPIVFVGRVTATETIPTADGTLDAHRMAYMDVQSHLKGPVADATVLTTARSCGVSFKKGEQYLVFAQPAQRLANGEVRAPSDSATPIPAERILGQAVETDACTLTGPMTERAPHLDMIRTFLQGRLRPMIYGAVKEYGYEFDGRMSGNILGPLAAIKVELSRPGQKITAITDANGIFSFQNLDPGPYVVTFAIPGEYIARQQRFAVSLEGAEDAKRLNPTVQARGEIRGRVTNLSGAGVKTAIFLLPIDAESLPLEKAPRRPTYSDGQGRFVFDAVRAGKYVLGVSALGLEDVYRPTVLVERKVLEVSAGELLEGVEFVMSGEPGVSR